MTVSASKLDEQFDIKMGERVSVIELFERTLARRGYIADESQRAAVGRLQQLHDEWTGYKRKRRTLLHRLVARPSPPRGVYMWGSVGRGKSFLMDSFFLSLPLERKCRVHFHHFMRDVHRELEELKGTTDPLVALAERIAKRYRLICFDEMHVNDIADAMILARLLRQTMDRGVVFCMTSNYRPDDLYKDGLKRDNFLPAIALINERLDIINVDAGIDYRRRTLEQLQVYLTPLNMASEQGMTTSFNQLAEVEEETEPLQVEGRDISYRHRAGGLIWFDFMEICGWGRSQLDYLEIARQFHTVMISNIPRIGLSLVDEGRRFTLLVDVFYDNKVKLIISAEAAPERLLKAEDAAGNARIRAMVFEFDRTASRLIEMQSKEYLDQQRTA